MLRRRRARSCAGAPRPSVQGCVVAVVCVAIIGPGNPPLQPLVDRQHFAMRRVQLLSRQLSSSVHFAHHRLASTLATCTSHHEAADIDTSSTTQSSPVLTTEHWKSWQERGYMVLKQVVPKANVQRLRDEVYAFVGAEPDNADTWYKFEGGMMRAGVSSGERDAAGAKRMDTTLNMWHTQGQW